MHDDCFLFRIWCGLHQLNLVMEHIMNEVVKKCFLLVMTPLITHLIWQHKLIVEMGIMCPRIINRWLYTYKVTKWFKIHRPKLLMHIESKHPASTPPRLWRAYLLTMDDFTSHTIDVLRKIQGLTTLVAQHHAKLNGFIGSFIDDIGMTNLFITNLIRDLDPMTHVFNGYYVIFLSNVQEFFVSLASWVEGIVNKVNEVKQIKLWHNVGLVFIMAYECINSIRFQHDAKQQSIR
jgi:hypothetical protein